MNIQLLLEIILVLSVTVSNIRLAHRKRDGWILYVLASLCVVILFSVKGSFISVMNQSIMLCLGLYSFWSWKQKTNTKVLQVFTIVSACVYIAGLFLWIGDHITSRWSEILLWLFIIGSRINLGYKSSLGWTLMLGQGVAGAFFALFSGLWIFFLWHVFLCFQSVYGLWKWGKA